MRLALCQINPTVGDIAGNAERIARGMREARGAGAELVLFPEMALTGYPPEDLLLKEHFLGDAARALQELAEGTDGIAAVVGFPERAEDAYNAAALLADGRVHGVYRKVYLPNYGVFDEQRYFQAGRSGAVVELDGRSIGLTVCEDIWEPGPPASEEALAGATLIVNISASPYHAGKGLEREQMLAQRARDNLAVVAFCGLVGGQDELVFDGQSCVIDHTGTTIARAAQFREELLLCDVDLAAAAAARLRDASHRPAARRRSEPVAVLPALPAPGKRPPGAPAELPRRLAEPLAPVEAEVYAALTLGLHDYVEKNGFEHVVLGLSGGIDSALVAAVAADALGPGRVSATIMPSPYSSQSTQQDARDLAAALGVNAVELPIAEAMAAYEATLDGTFAGRPPDLTEENLQARIRGNLLMALSNKFGWLVLTTGNKSEMSVGYSTLYCDLAGGFAVIKDVPKTLVYRLCWWRNSPAGAGA
ncbi:MAG: NAD+ synthase, partial [Solirubrobacteraceae bacterium]